MNFLCPLTNRFEVTFNRRNPTRSLFTWICDGTSGGWKKVQEIRYSRKNDLPKRIEACGVRIVVLFDHVIDSESSSLKILLLLVESQRDMQLHTPV